MKKLLLLDLDGTVRVNFTANVDDPSTFGFISHPLDQKIIPRALTAIKSYVADGWKLVACTNQAGVAAGKKSLDSCLDEQIQTYLNLSHSNCFFEYILAAHSYEQEGFGECIKLDFTDGGRRFHTVRSLMEKFRKPEAGMLNLAQKLVFDERNKADKVLFVGDRPEDKQAALNAGVPFMWAKDWWV